MNNVRFKRSTCFAIIAYSFLLLFSLIGLFKIINMDTFVSTLEKTFESIEMDLTEFIELAGMTKAEFYAMVYLATLVMSIASLLFISIGLLLSFLCFNDHKKTFEEFSKRKALHVTYVVFLGINAFMNSSVSISGGGINLITKVLLIVSFVFGIKGIQDNRKLQINMYKKHVDINNYPIKEDVVDISSEKQEEKVIEATPAPSRRVISQEELENTYSLLAKLEKSYQNNEVSKEEYERMKKTILDNLSK